MVQAGFSVLDWSVTVVNGKRELMRQEFRLMRDRLEQLEPFLSDLFGSPAKFVRFRDEFLGALAKPDTIYFCNKLTVTGIKS